MRTADTATAPTAGVEGAPRRARRPRRPRGPGVRPLGLALAALLAVLPWVVSFDGLSAAGHRMLGVFLAAVVLWVTEAVPLHATALLIIAAEVLLISDQALVAPGGGFDAPAFSTFYGALAHPVIVLFLGGFFLAESAAKYEADRNLTRVLLRPFGTDPKRILLGLMLITAALSMFMSNTATTATMMTVVIPVLGALPPGDRLRTGLALSVPLAANVGGIGTPVGTPPNAIALGALAEAGLRISFVQWMAMAVPFVLVLLAGAWFLLVRRFPSTTTSLRLDVAGTWDRSRNAVVFYATAVATIALWLSEPLHGIPAEVVAIVPVVVLLASRVFTVADLQRLDWHVLWLVAGGIALASGVALTGLDGWLVGLVSWDRLPAALLVAVLALAAIALSTVISNSATANLLVPIALTLAGSIAGLDTALAAVLVAVACSLAMALPISTPPNAVAYATGTVRTTDMAVVGGVVGMGGLALFLLVAPRVWSLLGLLP